MKKLLFVFLLCAFFASHANASFVSVYISQSGAGSQDGTSCANAKTLVFFNDPTNWGGASGQIGPSTVVHMCGTFTQEWDIRGSGLNGQPITLMWETNAKWMNTIITGDQAIYSGGAAWIVLDGGVPCGRPTDVCNGQIGNSANGTLLANHVPQTAITLTGASNWEIKNLQLGPLYVRTSVNDNNNLDETTHGITYANGYSNIHIHDSQIHDVPWAINLQEGSGNLNIEIDHNYIYHASHGGAFFHSNSSTTSNIRWHDNVVDGPVNWDGPNTGSCPYHHDGIHIASTGPGTFNTFYLYNNWYRGDWGVCNTSAVFIENNEGVFGNITNGWSFNNVYQNTNTTHGWSDGINLLPHSGMHVYNETIICPPAAGIGLTAGGTGTDEQNIIVTGCSIMNNTSNQNTTYNTLNNNLYANFISNGNAPFVLNGQQQAGGSLAASFATWKANTGKETGSLTANSAGLNSFGALQGGSVAIGAGANLNSIANGNLTALGFDTSLGGTRTPTARPSSGAWDMGAYNFLSSTPALCASSPVNFGSSTVGVTSGSSPITITITSCGPVAVTLSALPLTSMNGANPGDFQQIGGGANACTGSQVLNPMQTCNLRGQFTPTASGPRTATMRVNGTATVDVVLNGTGTVVGTTSISANPTTFNFGSVTQHTPSAILLVTLTNTGTLPFTWPTPITTFEGAFTTDMAQVGGTCTSGVVSNPGDSCNKQVQVTPSTIGLQNNMVFRFTAAPGVSATTTIQITSLAPSSSINITPRPVQFPSQTVLVPGNVVVATVTNTGQTSLQLAAANAITLGGVLAAHFVKQGSSSCNNNTPLAIAATCHIDYIWTPGATPALEQVTLTVATTTGVTNSVTMQGTSIAVVPQPVTNPLLASFKINFFPGVTIQMNGINFKPGTTTLTVDGTPVPTSCSSSTVCLATLPASMVLLPGFGVVGHLIGVK